MKEHTPATLRRKGVFVGLSVNLILVYLGADVVFLAFISVSPLVARSYATFTAYLLVLTFFNLFKFLLSVLSGFECLPYTLLVAKQNHLTSSVRNVKFVTFRKKNSIFFRIWELKRNWFFVAALSGTRTRNNNNTRTIEVFFSSRLKLPQCIYFLFGSSGLVCAVLSHLHSTVAIFLRSPIY